MSSNYEEKIRREWEKFQSNPHYPNIMLLGITGCGKSSLVNTVFNKDLARISDVARGTEDFKYYYGKDCGMSVNLIDSKGYEMESDGDSSSFDSYLQDVKNMINKNKFDPDKRINIIWYCISVASHRVQSYDTKMLNELRKIPEIRDKVSVVITKCDQDDENGSGAQIFRQILHEDVDCYLDIFEVSNDRELPLELKKLIEWSENCLDSDDLKDAFVSSQMVDIQAKRKRAAVYIVGYSAAAAAVGASPIPFSDAALLVPEQLIMVTHIINIYGMDNLASVSKAVVSNVIISTIGKSLAGSLLKLIPGFGTVLGAVINATVASLITSALGFAISEICYHSCKGILAGKRIDFENLFSEDNIKPLMDNFIRLNKGKSKDEWQDAIESSRED